MSCYPKNVTGVQRSWAYAGKPHLEQYSKFKPYQTQTLNKFIRNIFLNGSQAHFRKSILVYTSEI